MSERFDCIILGAGASGLSLAYHLARAGLGHQRVLLVERERQRGNDRTWCFWEATPGPFDHLVSKRWSHIWVHGEGLQKRLEIAPFAYKMIRGMDFYAFMDDWVDHQPNISRVHGEATDLRETKDGASVRVGDETYLGRWVFSSLYTPPQSTSYHSLLQHFKGWVIETPQATFDPDAATFMDFRVPQHGDTRFAYVLPTSPHRALVEFTLFSKELLPDHEYDDGLRHYLQHVLGIGPYTILETEFGVIPMTDAPFALQPSPHVLNIGTAGGCTKASTGYTFRRIQAQTQRIAERLASTGQPFYPSPRLDRHRWMDSVLLHVLETGLEPGHRIFSQLFARNPITRVLEFLNEETSIPDELALMSTMNTLVFTRSGLEVAIQGLRRSFTRHRAEDLLESKV